MDKTLSATPAALLSGSQEFEKIFEEEGVTAMDPAGKPYDALTHEVLGTVPKEGAENGQVRL